MVPSLLKSRKVNVCGVSMDEQILKTLQECSRDEKSFETLKELVKQLINEKNKAEKQLSLLEAAIRNDYDSIVITELNLEKPGPRIVYVNDGFCEMTGYSREEVLGKTPRILQGPKTDRETLDRLKKQLREGHSFFGQTINYRKDGSEFVNQWDIHPLTNQDGEITHWVSYQHDISERKRSEQMFVDNKVDFDQLDEESKRTLVDLDEQGNIVEANKAFRELVGYDVEELKEIKFWDLIPEQNRDRLRRLFEGSFDEDDFDNKSYRLELQHKSGVEVQVEFKTKLLKLKSQTLIRAEVKNISMRERVLSALQQRNNLFSNVFDQTKDYRYKAEFDESGDPYISKFSDAFAEITGLDCESYTGKGKCEEIIHPDDLDKFKQHLKNVKAGKSETVAYRIKDVDGNYFRVVDYAKPEWGSDTNEVSCIKATVDLETSTMEGSS